MPVDPLSCVAFLAGSMFAAVISSQAVSKAVRLQQDILKRGLAAQGKILRIWKPPLFGTFTRIYFEFEPSGFNGTLRGCHVDRRFADELAASLPAVGSPVSVRYLPDEPAQAVIARLVSLR